MSQTVQDKQRLKTLSLDSIDITTLQVYGNAQIDGTLGINGDVTFGGNLNIGSNALNLRSLSIVESTDYVLDIANFTIDLGMPHEVNFKVSDPDNEVFMMNSELYIKDELAWHAGNFDPNSKANVSHTHTETDITDLKNYALATHNHDSQYLGLTGGTITGNLGIGTAPTKALDVVGDIQLTNRLIFNTSTGSILANGVDIVDFTNNDVTFNKTVYLNSSKTIYATSTDIFFDNRQDDPQNPMYPSKKNGFQWQITSDGAGMQVYERGADRLDYVFWMRDNVSSSDRYLWKEIDWRGNHATIEAMELTPGSKLISRQKIESQGLVIKGARLGTVERPRRVDKTLPFASVDIVRNNQDYYDPDVGASTLTLEVDTSGFTGTTAVAYAIVIKSGDPEAPNTFNWSTSSINNDPNDPAKWTGFDVPITGDWQDLGYGIKIRFNSTTGGVTGEKFGFTVLPALGLTVEGGGASITGATTIIGGILTQGSDSYTLDNVQLRHTGAHKWLHFYRDGVGQAEICSEGGFMIKLTGTSTGYFQLPKNDGSSKFLFRDSSYMDAVEIRDDGYFYARGDIEAGNNLIVNNNTTIYSDLNVQGNIDGGSFSIYGTDIYSIFAPISHTHTQGDITGSIDANTLDGIDSSQFVRNDQNATINGALTIISSDDGILKLRQSDAGSVVDAKEGGWNYIAFYDGQGDRQGYFGIHDDGSFVFYPEVAGATVRIGNNEIWHAGNFSPASKSDVGHTHTNIITLNVDDTRSVDTATDLGLRQAKFEFKANSTDGLTDGGGYHGVLTFQQWNDSSGGNTHQLAFTVNGNLHYRTAPIGGSWGSWMKIWHSGNDGAGSGLNADLLDGQEGSYYLDWNNFTNKPATYTPSAHTHTESDITDLKAYALATHNHDSTYLKLSGGTITGNLDVNGDVYVNSLRLNDYLGVLRVGNDIIWHEGNFNPSSKANASHTHTESDITDLQNYALATHNHDSSYLKLAGGTLTGNLTLGTNKVITDNFQIYDNGSWSLVITDGFQGFGYDSIDQDTLRFTPLGTEAFEFDADVYVSGYLNSSTLRTNFVGINTTVPSTYRLVVKESVSSDGSGIQLLNADSSKSLQFWVGTGGAVIDAEGTTNLHLRAGGIDRIYVRNSDGYVGVNKTNPSYRVDVSGTLNATTLREGGATLSSKYASSSHTHSVFMNVPFIIKGLIENGAYPPTLAPFTGVRISWKAKLGTGTCDLKVFIGGVAMNATAQSVNSTGWTTYSSASSINEDDEIYIEVSNASADAEDLSVVLKLQDTI